MISRSTLAPLILVFKFGTLCTILPFYWNEVKNHLEPYGRNTRSLNRFKWSPKWFNALLPNYPIWKVTILIGITLNFGQIVLAIYIAVFRPKNCQTEEVILALFFGSANLVTISWYLFFIFSADEFMIYFNGMLEFNKISGK